MIFREITLLSILLRLLCAVVLGGAMGIEREKKNRPAGLRTYMLVCVGACLIMLTNQYIYQTTGAGDPMRLGAQVVSGIGFLGAGTIIVTKRNQIKGLTTAAGLWAVAGIGLALGIGFYEAALIASFMAFLILSVVHRFDARMHRKSRRFELYIEHSAEIPMGQIIRAIREKDVTVEGVQVENENVSEHGSHGILLSLKLNRVREHEPLLKEIGEIFGVLYLEEL